ncbi:capsular polysaccharide synthesis protein [Thioclava pacifica]|nr:capsular polysaccharide synthesis protein [Thioclava pacifica]
MAIYSLWYQGFEQAPEMIQRLHRIWQETHGIREVKLLAGAEADDLIAAEGIDPSNLSMQIRSDLLRLILLADRGGVWVDATLLPSARLDSWLPNALGPSGFFAYFNENPDRLISSWFLAAHEGNPLVRHWRDQFVDYLKTPRKLNKTAPIWARLSQELRRAINPASFASKQAATRTKYYPYFILHYHFDYLLRKNPVSAEIWKNTPKLSGKPGGRLKSACNSAKGDLDMSTMSSLFYSAPVHKLNWRKPEMFAKILDFAEAEFGIA